MKVLNSISKKAFSEPSETVLMSDIYNIAINGLDGLPLGLAEFRGKHLIFVNVASKCGFTKQYKDLEKLYQKYKDTLMVIGVPCNQFGSQEPGNHQQIKSFCEMNYGVTFMMTEKIDVKGKNKHPLYQWLTEKESNGQLNSMVRWNFQKYLVDPNGQLVDFYYSTTSPLSSKIIKQIGNS